MTEAEWLTATHPNPLLEHLRGSWQARLRGWLAGTRRPMSERKLRLVACACFRRIWERIVDERRHRVVEIAEMFADGNATQREMSEILVQAYKYTADPSGFRKAAAPGSYDSAYSAAIYAAEYAALTVGFGEEPYPRLRGSASTYHGLAESRDDAVTMQDMCPKELPQAEDRCASRLERLAQTHIVRDIFGNPFRPVTVDPAWRTSTVVSLAQGIYDERAFDRLPILADALEDAGCTNADMLNHCRQPGDHVRGCWCVDLLLDKR